MRKPAMRAAFTSLVGLQLLTRAVADAEAETQEAARERTELSASLALAQKELAALRRSQEELLASQRAQYAAMVEHREAATEGFEAHPKRAVVRGTDITQCLAKGRRPQRR